MKHKLVVDVAARMRQDAATGMPERVLKHVNFTSLAISAIEGMRASLIPASDEVDAMIADLWQRRHSLTPKEWEEVSPMLLGILVGKRLHERP